MTFHSLDARELAKRRLRQAIVASLVIHVLVLFWPGPPRVLTKDTPSVLHATLRSPQPTELALAKPPARAVSPAPTPAPTSVPSAPKVLKPEPSTLEQARPPSVPQTPAVPAESVAKPATGPAPAPAAVATSAPAGPAGSTSGVLLTETNASGETVDSLRVYRMAVAVQARRFKRYPAQAMASGWEGSADIRLEVGSDGRPRAASVVRSSGHELLDRAALTMIDAGALRARLPDTLRGKAFAVVLPVFFNLDDE
ncbi:MAG: TonB family protein [Rhodocyclales bacterium]|nr:TonB family protein [Rhodocyclales bacterium]